MMYLSFDMFYRNLSLGVRIEQKRSNQVSKTHCSACKTNIFTYNTKVYEEVDDTNKSTQFLQSCIDSIVTVVSNLKYMVKGQQILEIHQIGTLLCVKRRSFPFLPRWRPNPCAEICRRMDVRIRLIFFSLLRV